MSSGSEMTTKLKPGGWPGVRTLDKTVKEEFQGPNLDDDKPER